MKIERVNPGTLFLMVAAGVLVYAGAAYPQTEKKIIEKPGEPKIALHRVTETSPAVDLATVSKEVSPGVLEVDPNAIAGKRLMVPGGAKAKNICLGKWITLRAGPTCEGSWVQL